MSDVSAAAGLAGFLLERIAEDEADERAETGGWPTATSRFMPPPPLTAWERAVDAKYELTGLPRDLDRVVAAHIARWDHARVLRALALPYADHPDFRPEWRA